MECEGFEEGCVISADLSNHRDREDRRDENFRKVIREWLEVSFPSGPF
jgi:hypothetical protein